MKHCLARLLRARFSWLDFGYVPSDLLGPADGLDRRDRGVGISCADMSAFALADSPVGLLAFMLRHLGAIVPLSTAVGLRRDWSRQDLLTWTMLYWLPGPEAPLKWLRAAASEKSILSRQSSVVVLGVSFFKLDGLPQCPPVWTSCYYDLRFLRRHNNGSAPVWPLWEQPSEIVVDLRDFVQALRSQGLLQR